MSRARHFPPMVGPQTDTRISVLPLSGRPRRRRPQVPINCHRIAVLRPYTRPHPCRHLHRHLEANKQSKQAALLVREKVESESGLERGRRRSKTSTISCGRESRVELLGAWCVFIIDLGSFEVACTVIELFLIGWVVYRPRRSSRR